MESRHANVSRDRGLSRICMVCRRYDCTHQLLYSGYSESVYDMLTVSQKAADSQDVTSGCRFEEATAACRPDKVLLPQTIPDWHWWLLVQSAFHSGDLQKASPAEAHVHHGQATLPACLMNVTLLSGTEGMLHCPPSSVA